MSVSRLQYLLQRYLKKECTQEEFGEFLQMIDRGENDEVFKQLIANQVGDVKSSEEISADATPRILRNILGSDASEGYEEQLRKPRVRRSYWKWLAAASIALVVIVAGFKLLVYEENPQPFIVAKPDAEQQKDVTGIGQTRELLLPDGSKVWLSPSSSLSYPLEFSSEFREVSLSGEAFFEVAGDSLHPFIIHSGNIKTKVLGTSFNIQAYENRESIAVMVVTGKVKVSSAGLLEDMELLPNQRAVFNKKTDRLIKEIANEEQAPGMLKRKEGTFEYHNEPLYKITTDIETYFGIRVNIAERIRDCKVVASFEVSDKPESILEIIAITIHGDLERTNESFLLTGDRCSN